MYQLRNAFGGYCDKQNALDSVFGDGVTRNPWRDGGCVPGAPGNTTVTAIGEGNVTVFLGGARWGRRLADRGVQGAVEVRLRGIRPFPAGGGDRP